MEPETAFLQAIIESPEDDTPRLVFADWLEDHGQAERGQFIRLHVEWCRRPADAPPDEGMRKRLVEAWRTSGLPGAYLPFRTPHVYDRGLIAGVRFSGRGWMRQQVEAVCQGVPIRVASFDSLAADSEWLLESPLLAQWTGFCGWVTPKMVAPLLEVQRLAGLNLLHLRVDYSNADAEKTAHHLAAAGHLDHLTVLDLDGTHIGDEGLAALAAPRHLHSLRKLTMGSDGRVSHRVGEAGLRALAESRSLTHLTHLGFRDCHINGSALRWLLRSATAGQLLELDLAYTDLGEDDVIELARCRKLKTLRRLCLSSFELSDKAVKVLAGAKFLPSLRELYVEASEEYGGWDGQAPELLAWLQGRLGARLSLSGSTNRAFQLSPVGEEDRIWGRLQQLDEGQEHDVLRIL